MKQPRTCVSQPQFPLRFVPRPHSPDCPWGQKRPTSKISPKGVQYLIGLLATFVSFSRRAPKLSSPQSLKVARTAAGSPRLSWDEQVVQNTFHGILQAERSAQHLSRAHAAGLHGTWTHGRVSGWPPVPASRTSYFNLTHSSQSASAQGAQVTVG